jgi:hypothetical protein
LFQLTLPEAERSIENIEAHVEDLFRRPLGKMPQRLGLDADVTEVLRIAVGIRNKMAHEIPFMATTRVNTGGATLAEEMADIDGLGQAFMELHAALDATYMSRLRAMGHEPDDAELSPEAIGHLLWRNTVDW